MSLRVSIKLVRPLQKRLMPALVDLLQAEEETSENVDEADLPEEDALYFPSNFGAEEREEYGLQKLADLEMKMRRCYAESELELLKLSIRLYHVDVKAKRRQVEGIERLTRANAKLAKDIKRRDKRMERYNNHYTAMLALGYDADDKFFQAITPETMKNVRDVNKSQEKGSGRTSDAWFWRDGKDVATVGHKTDEELLKMNEEGTRCRSHRCPSTEACRTPCTIFSIVGDVEAVGRGVAHSRSRVRPYSAKLQEMG